MMLNFDYPWDIALAQLVGKDWEFVEDPRSPETIAKSRYGALLMLKDATGQDFGYDVAAWRDWLEAHPEGWLKWLEREEYTANTLMDFYARHSHLLVKRRL